MLACVGWQLLVGIVSNGATERNKGVHADSGERKCEGLVLALHAQVQDAEVDGRGEEAWGYCDNSANGLEIEDNERGADNGAGSNDREEPEVGTRDQEEEEKAS
eukprot:SAG31_NODE_49_length_30599_cov_15.615016_31_plen_104_part_00